MKKYALSAIILASVCCYGAMKPDMFVCTRQVRAPSQVAGEIAAFRLDRDIYRNTKDGFADMRLFGDQNREIAL